MIYKGIKVTVEIPFPSRIAGDNYGETIIDRIIEMNDIEVPQAMVEEEASMMMTQYRHQLQYENMISGIRYDHIQENMDEVNEKFRKEAAREIKKQRIIRTIIDEEKLQVSQEELEREAKAIADRQQIPFEMVKGFLGEGYGMLKNDMLEKKTMDFLCENVVICMPQ